MIEVKVKKLIDEAVLPRYATPGAACFDLHSINGGEVGNFGTHEFRTGLAFEIPDGHAMLIFSRSGHGFNKSLRLANCVGVIDSDYRGEVVVKLRSDGPVVFGFESGDRVAQAMVIPVERVTFGLVDELSETDRGAGGFGSTGNA